MTVSTYASDQKCSSAPPYMSHNSGSFLKTNMWVVVMMSKYSLVTKSTCLSAVYAGHQQGFCRLDKNANCIHHHLLKVTCSKFANLSSRQKDSIAAESVKMLPQQLLSCHTDSGDIGSYLYDMLDNRGGNCMMIKVPLAIGIAMNIRCLLWGSHPSDECIVTAFSIHCRTIALPIISTWCHLRIAMLLYCLCQWC